MFKFHVLNVTIPTCSYEYLCAAGIGTFNQNVSYRTKVVSYDVSNKVLGVCVFVAYISSLCSFQENLIQAVWTSPLFRITTGSELPHAEKFWPRNFKNNNNRHWFKGKTFPSLLSNLNFFIIHFWQSFVITYFVSLYYRWCFAGTFFE